MKAKITKRVILLCVALTIAVVITFGRRDGQPKIDNKSDASTTPETLALRADGNPDTSGDLRSSLPALGDIPVFGPQTDDDATTDALAALPELPSLDELAPSDSAETTPDATTSPLPNPLDDLPSLDSTEPADQEPNDGGLPELDLPPLPDLNAASPIAPPKPDAVLPSLPSFDAPSLGGNNEVLDTPASTSNVSGSATNSPVAPYPPPFTASPVAEKPKEPELSQPAILTPKEPVARTAQRSPSLSDFATELPRPELPTQSQKPLSPVPAPTNSLQTPTLQQPKPLTQPSLPTTMPAALATAPPVATVPAITRPRQSMNLRGAQRHRVIDGETLESISKRYYGTPAYAMEIFQANRRVMARPDLLTIGTHLAVPNPGNRSQESATAPAPPATLQTNRQPATDPFLAMPTELLSSQPTPLDTNGRSGASPIPESRRLANPLPTIIEDGSIQDRTPQTRLVPVPSR